MMESRVRGGLVSLFVADWCQRALLRRDTAKCCVHTVYALYGIAGAEVAIWWLGVYGSDLEDRVNRQRLKPVLMEGMRLDTHHA